MDRIAKLKEFLEANPEDSFLQHALALEYLKLGDEQEAKKHFEELLSRDENYVGSYYHLAALLQRLGEPDAAIRCYEKGMQKARESGDKHAFNELKGAYDDLVDSLDE